MYILYKIKALVKWFVLKGFVIYECVILGNKSILNSILQIEYIVFKYL